MNLRSWCGLLVLLGAWMLAVVWSDPFFIPAPWVVAHRAVALMVQPSILGDIGSSVTRVVSSFVVAAMVGVPVGLWLGLHRNVLESVSFVIDFFRSTPATAMIPVFLLWFGVGDASKIAVAAFSSALVIVFNVSYGVSHAEKARVLAARIMGATRFKLFSSVVFWESLPSVIIGLRNAVSISLIVIIVTEMVVGTTMGIGRRIIDFQSVYDIAGMYTMILVVGFIGYLLNAFFSLLEHRLVHWHQHV